MITMFYDHTCVLCRTEAHVLQQQHPTKIRIVTVEQGETILAKAGISQLDAMTYLCVQDNSGTMFTGMAAVRKMYSATEKPFAFLLYLPIIKQFGNWLYPIFARNRYNFPNWFTKLVFGTMVEQPNSAECHDGTCKVAPKDRHHV